MTSGKFKAYPIDSIVIDRANRQRREVADIETLADSIKRLGLIHPIVIQRDGTLVAGERRLTACRSLGWTAIPVQFVDEIDPALLHAIELEENVKRLDLTWQDQTKAIEEYHRLQMREQPEWNIEKTATALGLAKGTVYQHINVAKEIAKDERVAKADKFSVARNIVERKNERIAQAIKEEIHAETKVPDIILNADFTQWAPAYAGAKFNLIHCDFPYGVGMDKSKQGTHVETLGAYDDSQDVYWKLLSAFTEHQDKFVAESAHLVFWFSMNFYSETVKRLTTAGWNVIPHPLIWAKSDNTGILSDPNRRPRHVYETALLAARGDRKLVRAKSDYIASPATKDFHISEKPEPVVSHFLEMLVDGTSTVLDPTAGSGTALRVARRLGANRIFGLELNPDFAAQANARLK